MKEKKHTAIRNRAVLKGFGEALWIGRGGAWLMAQANTGVDFSKALIKAAKVHPANDPQSEGDRAGYLFRIMEVSGSLDACCKPICKAVESGRAVDYVQDQLLELTVLFAKAGYRRAAATLKKMLPGILSSKNFYFYVHIFLHWKGDELLPELANMRGRQLWKDPEDTDDGWWVDHYAEVAGRPDAWKMLRQAARKNSYIKYFLKKAAQQKQKIRNYERPVRDYAWARTVIDNRRPTWILRGWGDRLSPEDRQRLAEDALKETDPLRMKKLIDVFRKVPFPYGPDFLLEKAALSYRKHEEIVIAACNALRHFQGNAIRALAMKRIAKARHPQVYLPLLIRNYHLSDAQLLTKLVDSPTKEHLVHWMATEIIDIYKANPGPSCEEPLESLYYRLNCGMHRADLVRLMMDNKVLPASIKNELPHDSYDEVRNMV